MKTSPQSMETVLHITSGDLAGDSLDKSNMPGEVFVWHDILYDGPRSPGWPDDDTLQARARFLEEVTGGGLSRKKWKEMGTEPDFLRQIDKNTKYRAPSPFFLDDLLFLGRDYEPMLDRFEVFLALIHAEIMTLPVVFGARWKDLAGNIVVVEELMLSPKS